MIVMSTAARKVLDAMKRRTNKLTYDACSVEWYAHTYTISTLESWWKSKVQDGVAVSNSHEWFLPEPGSTEWNNFREYTKKITQKKIIFELTWDDNLKQVYHYLCDSILLCDFGVEEFRRITLIAIHPLRKVQKAVKIAKDSCRGLITTPYILGILERGEQAEQVKDDRIQKKITDSQKGMAKVNARRATSLEATLMKAQFMEVRRARDLDRLLNIAFENLTKESRKACNYAMLAAQQHI